MSRIAISSRKYLVKDYPAATDIPLNNNPFRGADLHQVIQPDLREADHANSQL